MAISQNTAPVIRKELPFEITKEYRRKEAIIKAALLLKKLRYDIASSSVEPMVQVIDKRLQEPSLPPESRRLLQFLSQEVLPSLAEAKTTIISNKDSLIGLKLKGRNQTEERIVSLDFDSIKLTQTTNKGSLDRTLTWDYFRREGYLVELCNYLLEHTPPTLNNYKPYLALLLFCGQIPCVENTLKSLPATETDTLHNWLALVHIQQSLTPASRSIIEMMDTLRLACINADDHLAASIARRILAANQDALLLEDADRQTIVALLDKFSYALPDIQAGNLARKAKRLQMQGQINAALNTALAAFFRFGRATFPEKTALDATIKEAFARLDSPIPLQIGGYINCLPFCNHYPPAHNLVVCRDASTIFKDEINSKPLESMYPIARFACGDWSKANDISTLAMSLPSAIKKAPTDAQELAKCLLIFAKALCDTRFSDTPVSQKSFTPLMKKLQRTDSPDAHTMALLTAASLMLFRADAQAPTGANLAEAQAPTGANRLPLEQHFLTKYNYDGTIQARRTVFYHCLTLILENSPSSQFRSDFQNKSQDAAFLDGYGFQGIYKRFFDKLVNSLGNAADFPLEHLIDKDVDWGFLRAWLAVVNTGQGLPDNTDTNMMDYLDSHALNWPLQGGDTIMTWLLSRCANCLYNKKLDDANQLTDWVLSRNYACLISHYPSLLALSATLKALDGKTGGIQTAASLIQAATISPKSERAAFRALADLQPQFTTAKFNRWLATLPKHKEYTFWMNLMGSAIAFNLPQEPMPPMVARTTPSQVLLANALGHYTQR